MFSSGVLKLTLNWLRTVNQTLCMKFALKQIIHRCYEWVINHVPRDAFLYDWGSSVLCILWRGEHHGAPLTASSISTACPSSHQMPALLHKVEEERCHSLNRIYGLSLRHKLEGKYITVEVASSAATCLYHCCAKAQHCRTIRCGYLHIKPHTPNAQHLTHIRWEH